MPRPVDLKLMNKVQHRIANGFENTEAWLTARGISRDAFADFCDSYIRQAAAEDWGVMSILGVGIQLGYEIRRAQENDDGKWQGRSAGPTQ
jgi:hypothetical protein